MPRGVYERKPVDRLALYEAKIDRSAGDDGCHPWLRYRNSKGYGRFNVDGVNVIASRWGYEHYVGPIPDGMKVLHTCDNPPCQNPDHWFLGTDGDNMRDKMAKGRGTPPPVHHGEAQHSARLNSDKVREIRARAARGETNAAMAREFGVSKNSVRAVVIRTTWKHVE